MAGNYKFVNYAGAEMAELFDKIADLDVATQSKAGLMSDTDKTKLDNLPAGAQANVLEGVQLAGVDLDITDKKVNIPVDNAPTEGSSALIRSGAVFSALAGIHQFRVVIVTELPASGEELVLYLVGPTGTGPDKYEEYLWNNNAWVKIGDTSLDISGKADKDTDAVAGNLAEFDANGNPVDSGIAKGKIAEIEGKVTELGTTAGISEGIADSISAGTAQEIVFRKSGGDGVNYVKRFKGRTLVWNQLVNSGTTEVATISGRKYLTRISGVDAIVTSSGTSIPIADATADNVFDLTKMFGAGNEPTTVEEFEAMFPDAYYPYNAGTLISNDASALETVGFNQWDEVVAKGAINLDTGVVAGSNVSLVSTLIPIIGGKSYYFKSPSNMWVATYDANKNFLGALNNKSSFSNRSFTLGENVAYVRFGLNSAYGTTYNHDICINLSDASKNGTYEPYWKRTINLGLDSFKVKDGQGNVITITGGLKSAGTVHDEIVGNKYIKRIETRAYQSGDESNSAVTTDGTNTNYAIATPVEYELAEPMPNAILVDELGTEKAVFPTHEDGSPSAPLCTDSNYSISVKNLLAKLNE